MILFVIKNAAVRPYGLMFIGSWSKVNVFSCAQYPIIISYNSIVVRPPYKKLALLTKKRFVSLHSQKHFQRMVYFFLLTAWVFESMEKPIDFWLRKGKVVGETKPTESDVFGYNKYQRSCGKV